MAVQEYPCDRYRPLRLLKGPLWMADLMDIFQAESVSELRRKIRRKKVNESDFTDESKLYHKYNRGEVLPGKAEVEVWLGFCDVADRVNRLPLWDLIEEPILFEDEENALFDRLSPAVTQLVSLRNDDKPRGVNDVRLLDQRSVLTPLVRFCSIDALTYIFRIIDKIGYYSVFDAYATRLINSAVDAFLRLSVFPPFQSVRRQFLCHVGANFFARDIERGSPIWCPTEQHVMDRTDDIIELLTSMGRVGLVGRSREAQVKIVNWCCEKVSPRENEALRDWCAAALNAPVKIPPSDPAWQALKRLRHPGTRTDRPIVLPWKGKLVNDFRIANALGEATTSLTSRPVFTC